MTYQQAIDYLYSRLPIFQNQGARAYKPGLTTTREFCRHLGDPQHKFRSIHIGGTNGKGSTSHMLAAVLQTAGYRVGLYTSPHLKSFTERIRINGQTVREDFVARFVEEHSDYIEQIRPSFFEATVAMAFSYFAAEKVDIAVIEVGMGGRLDSTNVIVPVLSLITNISYDHMQFLGDTLPKIAAEKAGIIKSGVPLVITESAEDDVMEVFRQKAAECNAPLYPADELVDIHSVSQGLDQLYLSADVFLEDKEHGYSLDLDLTGEYQQKNIKGVLVALTLLQKMGYSIPDASVIGGLSSVKALTGLKGRWQTLSHTPRVICDTAHNEAGLRITLGQLYGLVSSERQLRFVLGFVADKDLDAILRLFPQEATYYFCQPANLRALAVATLHEKAATQGLHGLRFENVNTALKKAMEDSVEDDVIYVGGSTFVVADLDHL